MDISREEFMKLSDDLAKVKNDVNLIKAHTQLSANIQSLVHSSDLVAIVFNIANSERLCKALMCCKVPMNATQLSSILGVKPPNMRQSVLTKLISGSLLNVIDVKGKSEYYQRVSYLDTIGFDTLAKDRYPNLKAITI